MVAACLPDGRAELHWVRVIVECRPADLTEWSVTSGLRCVNSVSWYVADLAGQFRGMRSHIWIDEVAGLSGHAGRGFGQWLWPVLFLQWGFPFAVG